MDWHLVVKYGILLLAGTALVLQIIGFSSASWLVVQRKVENGRETQTGRQTGSRNTGRISNSNSAGMSENGNVDHSNDAIAFPENSDPNARDKLPNEKGISKPENEMFSGGIKKPPNIKGLDKPANQLGTNHSMVRNESRPPKHEGKTSTPDGENFQTMSDEDKSNNGKGVIGDDLPGGNFQTNPNMNKQIQDVEQNSFSRQVGKKEQQKSIDGKPVSEPLNKDMPLSAGNTDDTISSGDESISNPERHIRSEPEDKKYRPLLGSTRNPPKGRPGRPLTDSTRNPPKGKTGRPIPGGTRNPSKGKTGRPIPDSTRNPPKGQPGRPLTDSTRNPPKGKTGTPIPDRTRNPLKGKTGKPIPDRTSNPPTRNTVRPIMGRTRYPPKWNTSRPIPDGTRYPPKWNGTRYPPKWITGRPLPGSTRNPPKWKTDRPLPVKTRNPSKLNTDRPLPGSPRNAPTKNNGRSLIDLNMPPSEDRFEHTPTANELVNTSRESSSSTLSVNLGLWAAKRCTTVNEEATNCVPISVEKGLIRVRTLSFRKTSLDLSVSSWNDMRAEVILSLIFCLLGVIGATMTVKPCFLRDRKRMKLALGMCGLIISGVVYLIAISRVASINQTLTSDSKRIKDDVTVQTPWAAAVGGIGSCIAIVSAVFLGISTWVDERKKWTKFQNEIVFTKSDEEGATASAPDYVHVIDNTTATEETKT